MPERRAWRAGLALAAALAAANLLAGLAGGLARLGWRVPDGALAAHGAVMVGGFFGTLIALERAVALQRTVGLAAPLLAGSAGLAAWAFGRTDLAALGWLLAAAALVALYGLAGATRAWSLHLRVELGAAVAWGLGTWAWWRGDAAAATLGWMGFLVGTIAGERRELMQFVRLGRGARVAFVVIVGVAAAALLGSAAPAFWLACGALAAWLLRHDLAPRQWRRAGWVGHTGTCLSVGYVWLLAAAALGLIGAWRPQGAAAVAPHALLLGFVFAMVFGHAPIMLPALARLRPAYTPWARGPLVLMGASLLLRVAAVEAGSGPALAIAGAGHALAVAWFAMTMLVALRHRPAAGTP